MRRSVTHRAVFVASLGISCVLLYHLEYTLTAEDGGGGLPDIQGRRVGPAGDEAALLHGRRQGQSFPAVTDAKYDQTLIDMREKTHARYHDVGYSNGSSLVTVVPSLNYSDFFNYRRTSVRDMDGVTFLHHYERSCRQRAVVKHTHLPLCPCIPSGLVGPFLVDKKAIPGLDFLSRDHLEVSSGGEWCPPECESRSRVAVIIPYRDRPKHLPVLLKYLHPLLQRQLIHYRIFLVEQFSPRIFNKGALMNGGFLEIFGEGGASEYGSWDCVLFHDVDTIPQHDYNFYSCGNSPRHVGAYLSYLNYKLPYGIAFGGATLFSPGEFRRSNGFTSEFFGWGGEDDDMYRRVSSAKLRIQRFPSSVARYVKLRHGRDVGNPRNPQGGLGLETRREHYSVEGLNTVKYKVNQYKNLPLYTWLHLNITFPLHQDRSSN